MSDNQIQKIITFIPLIRESLKRGKSYDEINNYLVEKYNFRIKSTNPAKYISSIISQDNRNLLYKKFNNFKIIKVPYKDKNKFKEFCVEHEFGFFMTYQDVPTLDATLITQNNIHEIIDIKGCLLAKRILRLHSLPDAKIISDYKNKYNIHEFGKYDLEYIEAIHDKIIDEFENIITQLKTKSFFYEGLI
ncbi:MAG: hypothetical protein KBD37_00060 [Burkholderiales bacterium]|nr:hypothetical protein [Burkholderiales bacterium]